MRDSILLGLGRHMVPVPRFVWRRVMNARARQTRASLGFMSPDHHRVRDFVVQNLSRRGTPMPPEFIADKLQLDVDRVQAILGELERRLVFLFRNERGAVTWAYPVTVEKTPHAAAFSTGEEAYSP
jgi:hypothetical protein